MRIHFIGICGTAMGNAALLLRGLGHSITGSDAGVYPPMSDRLADAGIVVRDGFDGGSLPPDADWFVIGNAVSRGNPEVEWVLENAPERMRSLPDLIRRELMGTRPAAVVAGTHGKTTTTAMALHRMDQLGLNPGYLIGGALASGAPAAASGDPAQPFLIEGDEYDSAFFDKRSKFIHYRPRTLVIHNIEFDHGDIFRDEEEVHRTFAHLLRTVPEGGVVLYNGDDPGCRRLLPVPWCRCLSYGEDDSCDFKLEIVSVTDGGQRVRLERRGRLWSEFILPLWGGFNARNAVAACLLAHFASGASLEDPVPAVDWGGFKGVKRRQEVVATGGGWTVISDFAHHPTAIRETLGALRQRFPGRDWVTVLEPRSNTLVTRRFQETLRLSLREAGELLLAPVHRAERMESAERLDTAALAAGLREDGVDAQAMRDFSELRALLRPRLRGRPAKGGVLVLLSNGSLDGLFAEIGDWVSGRGEKS